jgi:hypothetical protein
MEEDVKNEAVIAKKKVAENHRPTAISERKLNANRLNAKKSTGPKTPRGQANSRRNALKHGLFARHSLEFWLLGEDSQEYDDLLNGLCKQYQPVGKAEELEVERIAQCWWKLKRAGRYEMASIHAAVRHVGGRELARQEENLRFRQKEDETLIRVLLDLKSEIDATNEIPKDLKDRIFAVKPSFNSLWLTLEATSQEILKRLNSGKIFRQMANDLSEEEYSVVLSWFTISNAIEFIEQGRQVRTSNVREVTTAEDIIPSGEALDKLLRYETAIERSLNRAQDRLERLQRRRRSGEAVPPPLNLKLTR